MDFRRSILDQIDPTLQPLPKSPFVAYVWPTELCSIGCAHCSFGSRRTGSDDQRLLAKHPEELVRWLVDAGGQKIVICGGGEPLDEPEFVVRAITAASAAGLGCEIYTSGTSLERRQSVSEIVRAWRSAWGPTPRTNKRFGVRLSVDAFHEDRIGLDALAEWIRCIEVDAPGWNAWLRGIRVKGDESIVRLARLLNADVVRSREGAGWMRLRSGRELLVEWKGFVFEERGRLDLLKRRGLELFEGDRAKIEPLIPQFGNTANLGRPLSARLTVTHRRIDLEIHSDCVVHVLESQAADLRMDFLSHSWSSISQTYYRDPLLHRIVEAGLPGVAQLISAAQRTNLGGRAAVPYSLQRLVDKNILAFITAAAVSINGPRFVYEAHTRASAKQYLLSHGSPDLEATR